MSDQNNPVTGAETADITPVKIEEFISKSPEEIALINAKSERKQIVAAIDAGTLCCLPDEKGRVDAARAMNLINNSTYHGVYQLLLKNHQKQNGFPTAEYGTFTQFEKAARFAGKEGVIKRGAHGFTITLNVDGKLKSERLFNIAQAVHPDAVRSYAAHAAREKQEYFKGVKGGRYREPGPGTEGPPIACSTAAESPKNNPERYLGEYFAALTLNREFKATPEQAAVFKETLKNAVFAKTPEGHINPYNLHKICNEAGKYCKSFIPEYFKQIEQRAGQAAPQKEQTAPKLAPKPARNRETESMGR